MSAGNDLVKIAYSLKVIDQLIPLDLYFDQKESFQKKYDYYS